VINIERRELRDIVIAAVVLVLVFSYSGFSNLDGMVASLPAAVLGVAAGFILHELAHRFFSRRFHHHAEFVLWREGLILAVVLAIVSNGAFTFAAPGAVMISGRADLWGNVQHPSRQKYGIIALAGPIVNIVLALVFVAAAFVSTVFAPVLLFAASINAWLAAFNMIPVPPLDGSKVFRWDRRIWIAGIAVPVALMFLI